MISTEEQTHTLYLTRNFPASRERVFDSFASLEAVKHWFGPSGCRVIEGEMDFRVGGFYSLKMETGLYGVVGLSGSYKEIERPGRLTFTWKWSGFPGEADAEQVESLVEIILKEEGDTTQLRLTQTGLASAESVENHHGGWAGSFDKLFVNFYQQTRGIIGWNELMSPDPEASKTFYGELLGWSTQEMPMPDGKTYFLFSQGPRMIGGLMAIPESAPEMPPHWGAYIVVDDVAASTAKARELGATVLVEPMEVGGQGTMAVIVDPQGAQISFWKCNG